jgi:hypothetical protein
MPELIHKVQAIMSQRYYGDITIVPDFGVEDYLNIVTNPTVEFLVDASLKGERATWPSKFNPRSFQCCHVGGRILLDT